MRTTDMLLKCFRYLHPIRVKPPEARTIKERLAMAVLGNWYQATISGRYVGSLPLKTIVGERLSLPHGFAGIFIVGSARIGNRVMILHHVTIGNSRHGSPVIGDDVFIGANSTIVGRTVIGNGARIGAGVTLVDADIPAGAVIVNSAAYDLTNRRFVRPVPTAAAAEGGPTHPPGAPDA